MTSKTKIIIGSVLLFLISVSVIIIILLNGFKNLLGSPSELTKDFVDFSKAKSKEESEKLLVNFLDSLDDANKKYEHKLTGEKISILITGIDSRLGSTQKHADANHLVNIWFGPGIIEIISIPRGTYAYAGFVDPPCDTSYASVEDSLADAKNRKVYTKNYLANVRAYLGRKSYMRNITRISGTKTIDYYVEFGFSQAIGLLELVGYGKKSVQILRLLRTRQVYGGQEHQRNYNQGQFIRQLILRLLPRLDTMEGDIMLRAALLMVDTNLDVGIVKEIIRKFNKSRKRLRPNNVLLKLKPKYGHKYFKYDFSDPNTVDTLYKKLATKALRLGVKDHSINNSHVISNKISRKLNDMIEEAQYYLVEDPSKLIRMLRIPYEQRAWFQIADSLERARIRHRICYLLSEAYKEKNDFSRARKVMKIMEMEERVFNYTKKNKN